MVILLAADMVILPAMQAIVRHARVTVRQTGTTSSSSLHIYSSHIELIRCLAIQRWASCCNICLFKHSLINQATLTRFSCHMDSCTVSGPEDKLAHLQQPERRSAKQWKGPLPEDMLAKLWTPGLMCDRTVPAMHCEVITLSQYLLIFCLSFPFCMIDGHAYNFATGTAITGQRVMQILGGCRWWKLCIAEVMWPLWSSRHWAASPKGGKSMLLFSDQLRRKFMLVTSNSRSVLNESIPGESHAGRLL